MVRAPRLRVGHDEAVGCAERTSSFFHCEPPLLHGAGVAALARKLVRGIGKRNNAADIQRSRHD
jgi:hypothetical protein